MTSFSEGSGGSVGTSLTRTAERIDVGVAEFRVSASGETLATRGLGSCVAVTLYDESAGVGGLSHFMLPRRSESNATTPTKFVDTGLELMVDSMQREGASVTATVARVAGGAHLLDIGDRGVGQRNVEATHDVLGEFGVPVVGEDTTADHSRSVEIDTATGEVRVVRPGGTVSTI